MASIDPGKLEKHLRHLTETIGVRLAGMPGEHAAADYLATEFKKAGARVSCEEFPVQARDVSEQQLEIFYNGAWHEADCSSFATTPGTNGEWIEASLVFFEGATGYQHPDLGELMAGNIVVHLGCHIESRENSRRLVAANPLGLLMVDTRYPGATALADAIFPAYIKACGAVPSLNVAFLQAWHWREQGATRARFRVVGGPRASTSSNVIAELPGADPTAGVIYLGAHHDTQADSVGADDNGSAVAGVIELARVLASLPRKRTIRLISFGAEEQLSVGSSAYVRRHRDELARTGGVIFNLDSFGSLLGWNSLSGSSPQAYDELLARCFEEQGYYCRREQGVQPYADHFPFNAAGIPGVTLMRLNCAGGRFFHHRPDDDMTRLDFDVMTASLNAVVTFTTELANAAAWPFAPIIPPADRSDVAHCWDDLFGGWSG